MLAKPAYKGNEMPEYSNHGGNKWEREKRGENQRIYALILGKPLVGRPIATEHIRALPITSKFG